MVTIDVATAEDTQFISARIVEFNAGKVPFTQKEPFVNLNFAMRDENGEPIGGIRAMVYCWNCLSVEVLWVRDDYRGQGLGAQLLAQVESEAQAMGCHLAHVDTFEFQAKAFYEKQGYEVFGRLDECPPGYARFYLKKSLG